MGIAAILKIWQFFPGRTIVCSCDTNKAVERVHDKGTDEIRTTSVGWHRMKTWHLASLCGHRPKRSPHSFTPCSHRLCSRLFQALKASDQLQISPRQLGKNEKAHQIAIALVPSPSSLPPQTFDSFQGHSSRYAALYTYAVLFLHSLNLCSHHCSSPSTTTTFRAFDTCCSLYQRKSGSAMLLPVPSSNSMVWKCKSMD